MWEADEQCEPEMVSGPAGRNSIVHVALSETINNASPSTVNVLRSMQTPLTRDLFCLLRSSSTTLGANISSAWIMARGYFGIFRAGRASGCMCYSPSLLSTLLTKMPNSGKILHSCAHLDTHTYTFGLRCWSPQSWRISMFSMDLWNMILSLSMLKAIWVCRRKR